MFNESLDYRSEGIFDQRQAKEFNRYITSNHKKGIVLHNLLHNRCRFCSSSFGSSSCRNCCLPICSDFKNNVNAKKLIRDLNAGRCGQLAKRIKPASKISVYGTATLTNSTINQNATSALQGTIISPSVSSSYLDVPNHSQSNNRAPSPSRLSPVPSVRNVLNISHSRSDSGSGSSPLPTEDLTQDINLSEMNLFDSGISDQDDDSPSAPSPGLLLYDNENEADVVFLIHTDDQNPWRIPAHSVVLESTSSEYFTSIASTAMTTEKPLEVRITNCDPDTFEAVLKYVYTQEVCIKSIASAILMFNASKAFHLGRLMNLCLANLCNHVNHDNVLQILSFLYEFMKEHFQNSIKFNDDNDNGHESREESDSSNSNFQEDDYFTELVDQLIIKCYSLVDFDAEKIITSEEFNNLSYDMVCNVLVRDTLNISNESLIFAAINQWAGQQCKKNCKELTDSNKRTILSDLLYYPRYLTMNLDDFRKGPMNSDVLNDNEKCMFEKYILSNNNNKNSSSNVLIPKHLQQFRMNVQRKYVNVFTEEFLDCDDSDDCTQKMEKINDEDEKPKKKKKSKAKRILNGIGEMVLFITVRLLD